MSISKFIANLLSLFPWSLEESSFCDMPGGTAGETWLGTEIMYGSQQQLCKSRGEGRLVLNRCEH